MGDVITFASGKGGVGKSTITASVAARLASMGCKILVIDGDVGLRNLDLLLGLQDSSIFDFSDFYYKKCTFEKCVTEHPDLKNLFFITAPLKLLDNDASENALKAVCDYAADKFDFMLIDAPAGIGNTFYGAVKCADRVYIVTTPDYTAMRDAERVSEIVLDMGIKNTRLIVNRVRTRLIKKKLVANIDEIIDSVATRLIGVIPEDENIIVVSNAGIPSTLTKSLSTHAINNIACRILGEDVKLFKFWKYDN